MKSVLALDQGTTGSTALVVADHGRVLGRGYREFPQHFPQPGWVEHDAQDVWRVTLEAAREAIAQARVTPAAIGISNQRETVVVWDRKSGTPLHRALVWQDRRTAARCRELEARHGRAFVAERTGLVWDPYFSATKIEWLLQNVTGLRQRAASGQAVFGTVDSWLVYQLTGGRAFVTDHTNASRTLLYNLARGDWDPELLNLFQVPRAALPDIHSSSGTVGTTDRALFGVEIPIAGIAGDQQARCGARDAGSPDRPSAPTGRALFS